MTVVAFDPRSDEVRRIERAFCARMAKRSTTRFALPASLIAFAAALLVIYLMTGRVWLDIMTLLPTMAFFLTFDLVRGWARRRAVAALNQAPIRNRATTRLTLDESGVTVDGAQILWSEVMDVARVEGGTVLVLSVQHAVPIPDAALPDGMTPATLLSNLSRWRTA